MSRFQQYFFGKPFIVESDHKPLEAIFSKPLSKCPLRLQRLRINLQSYDFTVKYKPGSQMYFADTLSRASYDDKNFDIIESDIEAQVNLLYAYSYISPQKYDMLKQESAVDVELQELIKVCKEGWPNEKKFVSDLIKPYWQYRDELTELDGVVYKSDQLVIPKSMRCDILGRLHYIHLGIEKNSIKST